MKVIPHDHNVCETYSDYEQYACFNSHKLADEFLNEAVSIDQYVEVEYNGKKIYRKCVARNGVNRDEVSLGARTRKILGVKTNDNVKISDSTWLKYQMHNCDASIKVAFVIAIVGLLCTVISTVIDVIYLFTE